MNDLRLSLVIDAIDNASETLGRIGSALANPLRGAINLGRSGAAALERFGSSYEGLAAMIGGGIEIKSLIDDDAYFHRIQAITGATDAAVESLKTNLIDTAMQARIAKSEIMDAAEGMRAAGADFDFIKANSRSAAAAIQLLGGSGREAGELIAELRRQFGITAPSAITQALATLHQQLIDIPGGFEAFSEASRQLMTDYGALGHTGLQAAKELGAVYAVIARGVGEPRLARSELVSFLEQLRTRQGVMSLQQLGVHVGTMSNAVAGVADASLPDIIQSIVSRITADPALRTHLSPELQHDLAVALTEAQRSGYSTTLQQKLGITGDTGGFLKEADDATKGLSGSLTQLRVALDKIGENYLTGPFNMLAEWLTSFNDIAAYSVASLGALAVLGKVGSWVGGGLGIVLKLARGLGLVGRLLAPVSLGVASAAEAIGDLLAFSPALSGFFAMVSGWALSFGAVVEAAWLGPLGVLVGVVGVTAWRIYERWDVLTSRIKEVWGGSIDWMKGELTYAVDWIDQKIDAITARLPDFVARRFPHLLDHAGINLDTAAHGGVNLPPEFADDGPNSASGSSAVSGEIVVRFENAPRGTRARVQSANPGLGFSLDLGYAMGAP